jgi:hypothetical protein
MHSKAASLALFMALAASGSVVAATPRDEVLRVAPADAAIIILMQNARGHVRNLADSPFFQWFPSTVVGKHLIGSAEHKQLRESLAMILGELGTSPAAVLDDVVGDAVLFAYSPAPSDRPEAERALILIRPRKVEALTKILDRMNEVQTRSGELKAVVRKEHNGVVYHERRKAGGTEFYCIRGDLFAFSAFESEVTAFIDRDRASAPASEKPPELLARLKSLGVADAAGVVLINPRALDRDVKAKVVAARADEQRFLARFAEIWTALDAAAVYLTLDDAVEVGVSVRFQPEKLPADFRKWLTGPRGPTIAESLAPQDALFAVSGQMRAAELLEVIVSVAPMEPGQADVKKWIASAIGPIVGRDKLPLVLDALGPNWSVWVEQPPTDGLLPTLAAAVEISGDQQKRTQAEKSLRQTIEFGFAMARVAYNTTHMDQIEVRDERNSRGETITSLVNDKGFPPGVRPSFAVVQGYLVVATSPDAIKRFTVPAAAPTAGGDSATLARFSGVQTRKYLQANRAHLARFLTDLNAGQEKDLREQLDKLTAALELVDSAVVLATGADDGFRLRLRVTLTKGLKAK